MKWRGVFILIVASAICAVAILKFSDLRSVLLKNNAIYMINQGKFSEAERRLKNLLEQNPSDTEATALLAETLMSQGEYSQAAAYYKRLVKLVPEQSEGHRKLKEALTALGDTQGAHLRHDRGGPASPYRR